MKIIKHISLVVLFIFFSGPLMGQSTETNYYSSDYMKVEPSNIQDYLACEKAWKKIHEYNKEQGNIQGWALDQVVSPSGSSCSYNFVTRQRFKSKKQLAEYQSNSYMPENWKSLLTSEEVELVNRTTELRTRVKTEVWSAEERILADDLSDADISVINYFKMPKGVTRSDHLKMERELWMPFHKSNVSNGNSKGWVLLNRELPLGNGYEYDVVTVDLYKDMNQFWEPMDEEAFMNLHPGKSVEDIMKKTASVGLREKAEIRKSIDSTD